MDQLLATVNDWLKHAEGKHAVLLGLNAGVVGVVINLVDFSCLSLSLVTLYEGWLVSLLIASMVISISSFLPILVAPKAAHQVAPDKGSINPMFFRDAASMQPIELAAMLKASEEPSNNDIWTAEQIVNNSRIALRKYQLFEKAVWVSFFGVLPPIALVFTGIRLVSRGKRS
jgi:hypothetical protein